MNKLTEENLKLEIANWIIKNTGIVKLKDGDWEIATTQIDSFGDTVYCFISQNDSGSYRVSDDSHLLFKLDPGQTDTELYQTAEEIIIGSGYEYDQTNSEFYVDVDEENLAQAICRLAQIQVAISYLN